MMLATSELRDATQAGGCAEVVLEPRSHESYVATDPGTGTRVVFPGPRMQLRTYIQGRNCRYRLHGTFVVELDYLSGDIVYASHRQLPVSGYGVDTVEALNAFFEAFDLQWQNLVCVDVSTLTPGGQRRRRAMQDAVDRIESLA